MRFAAALAVLSILAALQAPALGEAWPAYEVIVHPDIDVQAVDRKFVADLFLKKATRWDGDEQVLPVDQAPDSALRRRFSSEMLQRSVSAVKSYWQQLIFSGRGLPPPEVAGDEQVVAYVVEHPGAIGYVTVGTPLRGARILNVR